MFIGSAQILQCFSEPKAGQRSIRYQAYLCLQLCLRLRIMFFIGVESISPKNSSAFNIANIKMIFDFLKTMNITADIQLRHHFTVRMKKLRYTFAAVQVYTIFRSVDLNILNCRISKEMYTLLFNDYLDLLKTSNSLFLKLKTDINYNKVNKATILLCNHILCNNMKLPTIMILDLTSLKGKYQVSKLLVISSLSRYSNNSCIIIFNVNCCFSCCYHLMCRLTLLCN